MCSHHLIEPVACTPASGWEKGQVENQVGNLRDQMFRPKPRVKSLTELNAWLEDQCIAYAQRTKHPEFKDRTVPQIDDAVAPRRATDPDVRLSRIPGTHTANGGRNRPCRHIPEVGEAMGRAAEVVAPSSSI
jgi:hypothetical protein